jgi:hypothetical protein
VTELQQEQHLVPPSTGGHLVLRIVLAVALGIGLAQVFADRTVWSIGFGGRSPVEAALGWQMFGTATFVTLLLLVFGPQPRWATKWAWFWLAIAFQPLWLVFVLFEPVPLWIKQPLAQAASKLTGGWAFLIALLVGPLAALLLPGYADLF